MTMRAHFFLWLSIFLLATTVAGQAATGVTLSPAYGHPSTVVGVSGTSFGASEAVDVYVDQADTLLLVASSTGSISGSVTIPAGAAPGRHYITAIGRHTGDSAQTTFDVGTPWSQFGYSAAHLGTNPWENTLSPSNVATIGTKWISPAGSFGSSGATVAVNFGDVYVALEGGGIEALSASNGSVLWSFANTGQIYASPTVSGGAVYVGSVSNATLYALNATTGTKIWSVVLGGGIYSSATIANGIIYVGCQDQKVYALNASTGATIWTYTTGGSIDATPTVVSGVVYIGSFDHNVYALNASTGALIWKYPTGGAVESSAAVASGVVYVGSDDNTVYAIETQRPSAGSLLWNYTTGGSGGAVYASPAVANHTVFVGSSLFGAPYLIALDAATGGVKWTQFNLGPTASRGGVAVANGVVYLTLDQNFFYAVDAANGGILGTAVTGLMYFGSPSISDGVAYVAALGGSVYAFSLPPNLDTNTLRPAGPPPPASLHPDPRLRLSL